MDVISIRAVLGAKTGEVGNFEDYPGDEFAVVSCLTFRATSKEGQVWSVNAFAYSWDLGQNVVAFLHRANQFDEPRWIHMALPNDALPSLQRALESLHLQNIPSGILRCEDPACTPATMFRLFAVRKPKLL